MNSDYEDQIGSNNLTASATGVSRTAGRPEFSNSATFTTGGNLINTSMSSVPSGDSDVTLNCWFKYLSVSDQNIIMYSGATTTSDGLGFRFYNGNIQGVVDATGTDLISSYNLEATGDWCMLTVTYDASASQVKFYFNGVLCSTQTISDRDFDQILSISGFSASDTPTILSSGLIDEVSLFNEPLTAEQVRQLYSHPGLGGTINNDDIVLLWRFGNDLLDDSDRHHNGQNQGAATFGDGKIGQKSINLGGASLVYADNMGDSQITDKDLDLNSDDFTISVWFYITSIAASDIAGLIGKGDILGEIGWQFGVFNSSGVNKLRAIFTNGPGTAYAIAGSNTIATGEWHQAVFTRSNNDTIKFYLDGELDTTDSRIDNTLPYVSFGNLTVGFNWYDEDYLTGKIDEVVFEKVARTQKEIQRMYTLNLGRLRCD